MSYKENFICALVKTTGLSHKELLAKSPNELKEYLEQKNKKTIEVVSKYPYIGRGNVLRDRLMSRKKINQSIDKILANVK